TVTAAEDLARNPLDGAPVTWSFTTSNIDTALPKIVGVFPPNGTSEVTVDTSIVITFNEAVSIGTFSYFVSPNPGGWVENWDSTNNVVALTHNAFMTSTRYTVTVTAADDLAGNPLDRAPVTWSFTTFAPDTVAPELLGTVPSNDASEVTVDANIVITFSEAINTGTFSYSVSPDPGGWTASWNVMTDVVTLTHNTFMTSTRYTITVTAADDLAGNPLDGAPVTWFFTTAAIDTAAPKMLGKSPTNGASEVVVDANIIITFSEAINTGMFSYSVSPDPGGWTENWNSMNNVVTLTHNAFMTGTHYTVTVTAADDLAGNPLDDAPVTWSFTTFAPDAIAPEILGTSPVSSVSEAAVDANIVITFSEAISTGTFSYSISPDPGGWAASWNGTSNVVTLTHNTFMTGTRYTVTVTAADDLAGNPLDGAPVTWSFTTAAIDTVAPKILGTLPLDGASGVPANADIVITFSEAISTNTLIYSVFPDPGGWAASWNETNSAATLTHNAFMAGTQYTVTVTEAKDLANNSLNGTPATWSFTTLSQTYLPVVFRHAE
ncbi:MAG: Ig-like domain-containing protein, partial [Chloroflexi bacterium]|nr:Ig-like domain-containing protein [Chloroflexota bacterium]